MLVENYASGGKATRRHAAHIRPSSTVKLSPGYPQQQPAQHTCHGFLLSISLPHVLTRTSQNHLPRPLSPLSSSWSSFWESKTKTVRKGATEVTESKVLVRELVPLPPLRLRVGKTRKRIKRKWREEDTVEQSRLLRSPQGRTGGETLVTWKQGRSCDNQSLRFHWQDRLRCW